MCSFDGWYATIELVNAARDDRCRAKPEMTKPLLEERHWTLG